MRTLTLGTLHRKELVTETLVRERHEMSIGKNQEAAQNRRAPKPPRSLTEELRNLKTKRCFCGAIKTVASRSSVVSCYSN
jgi:hypothetical protein